jgi:hypothetical protein
MLIRQEQMVKNKIMMSIDTKRNAKLISQDGAE